eukprot:COSAG06_NODE_48741_length_330_cov_0.606061_2_plen_22_part_01
MEEILWRVGGAAVHELPERVVL